LTSSRFQFSGSPMQERNNEIEDFSMPEGMIPEIFLCFSILRCKFSSCIGTCAMCS